MFKNRSLLVLGILSLMLASLAISSFRANGVLSKREAAWNYAERRTNADALAGISSASILEREAAWDDAERRTNAAAAAGVYSDYFERHPELSSLDRLGQGASDYADRHPELSASAASSVDSTDYYFRHPELSVSSAQASIDLTDYYFRHLNH